MGTSLEGAYLCVCVAINTHQHFRFRAFLFHRVRIVVDRALDQLVATGLKLSRLVGLRYFAPLCILRRNILLLPWCVLEVQVRKDARILPKIPLGLIIILLGLLLCILAMTLRCHAYNLLPLIYSQRSDTIRVSNSQTWPIGVWLAVMELMVLLLMSRRLGGPIVALITVTTRMLLLLLIGRLAHHFAIVLACNELLLMLFSLGFFHGCRVDKESVVHA